MGIAKKVERMGGESVGKYLRVDEDEEMMDATMKKKICVIGLVVGMVRGRSCCWLFCVSVCVY